MLTIWTFSVPWSPTGLGCRVGVGPPCGWLLLLLPLLLPGVGKVGLLSTVPAGVGAGGCSICALLQVGPLLLLRIAFAPSTTKTSEASATSAIASESTT